MCSCSKELCHALKTFVSSKNDEGIAPPYSASDWFVGTQPSVSQSKSPELGAPCFSHPLARLAPILTSFVKADSCSKSCIFLCV